METPGRTSLKSFSYTMIVVDDENGCDNGGGSDDDQAVTVGGEKGFYHTCSYLPIKVLYIVPSIKRSTAM